MSASGDSDRAFCVVDPEEDLNEATREMMQRGAKVLVVAQHADTQLAGDVVGVVTTGDICHDISSKSQLLSRDRTLSRTR